MANGTRRRAVRDRASCQTIADVAREAGVSTASVSRTLSGARPVTQATATAVREAELTVLAFVLKEQGPFQFISTPRMTSASLAEQISPIQLPPSSSRRSRRRPIDWTRASAGGLA